MDSVEDKDKYVAQLKEVFDSCDTTGSQCLNESELLTLCRKLHLVEHSNFLVFNLISKRGLDEVKFEDFKNCFVALLSQTVSQEDVIEDRNGSLSYEENFDREVSPKFTFGRKKYGRRSRPASITDDGDLSTTLISPPDSLELSPVLSLESNQSKKSDGSSSGKRPPSPTYSQQPPLKSGRLTSADNLSDNVFAESQDESSVMHHRSNSEDMSSSFDSPVDYLKETWTKLGIGSDGYLTVAELALVCEHIGMDMTEEVIAQLFEKLDCDQDGRISFEEFLQGLFQHGEPQSCESSSPQKTETVFKEASRDDPISVTSLSGIFTCLDSNKTGYAGVTSILELWESLELPCSPRLLEEFGFNTKQKINLGELTSVLEEELINCATTPLGQLALVSYQNELNYLRQVNEQICTERNKLHENVEEANARASLLAQEVDDNHAKLENALYSKLQLNEKKYQKQIRDLLEQLQQEQETLTSQSNKIKQQLQAEIQSMRDEEFQLKNRLNALEQENKKLELDLQEMTENYLETKKQNDVLQKELSVIPELKEKLADLESQQGEIQEHHHEVLLLDIERYKRVIQELQDKIDELTLEIEGMHQQNTFGESVIENVVTRTHSWLSDYKKSHNNGFKRRGSDSSSDDNSDDETPTGEKIRRTYFSPESEISVEAHATGTENPSNSTKKVHRPSAVDILVRDLFVEKENLVRKLHTIEETKDNIEYMNKNLKYKCRALNRLAYDIAKASVA